MRGTTTRRQAGSISVSRLGTGFAAGAVVGGLLTAAALIAFRFGAPEASATTLPATSFALAMFLGLAAPLTVIFGLWLILSSPAWWLLNRRRLRGAGLSVLLGAGLFFAVALLWIQTGRPFGRAEISGLATMAAIGAIVGLTIWATAFRSLSPGERGR